MHLLNLEYNLPKLFRLKFDHPIIKKKKKIDHLMAIGTRNKIVHKVVV